MIIEANAFESTLRVRALFGFNIFAAVVGGLSLVMTVAAPFAMGMTSWEYFHEVLLGAAIIGGFPLACAMSVLLSRWLFYCRQRWTPAVFVAAIPFLVVSGLFAWALVSR
jgi:hypothetical protein